MNKFCVRHFQLTPRALLSLIILVFYFMKKENIFIFDDDIKQNSENKLNDFYDYWA